jgi:hypothetical protein
MITVITFGLVVVASVAYVVRTAWHEHGYEDTSG